MNVMYPIVRSKALYKMLLKLQSKSDISIDLSYIGPVLRQTYAPGPNTSLCSPSSLCSQMTNSAEKSFFPRCDIQR